MPADKVNVRVQVFLEGITGPRVPITPQRYRQLTETEWKKRKVISLVPLRNSIAELPAGTVFTIYRKYNGFKLESLPCERCGIKLQITHVPPRDLMEALE
jgi:hypothetical protein